MQDTYIYIVGAGIMQVPSIQTAKSMGLKTIVVDFNPSAPGMAIADVPTIMSTKDIEGNVRTAKNLSSYYNIKGVLTVGTDASMTVAAVANNLGLPGIKYETAEAATNKIKMRTQFLKYNVPSPLFFGIWSLEEAYEAVKQIGYPFVIKPADNMGARGVRRVNSEKEIVTAFKNAKKASTSGEVIIEELMTGDELSIDMLIYNNKIILSTIADRIIKYPPYFIEVGHILPSQKNQKLIDEAVNVMYAGVKAVGINIGAAKGDIKLTSEGPKIVEIAARLSGGFMSGFTYPYATGQNIIKYAVEIALGKEPKIEIDKYSKVAIEHALIPKPGKIYSIEGIEKAKNINGLKNIFLNIEEGQYFGQPTSNLDKAGNIIVTANTFKEAWLKIEKVLKTIKINTREDIEINYDKIRSAAQSKLLNVCRACKICDGNWCAGMIPGMGGIGTGNSFKNNIKSLEKYKINLKVIHNIKKPSTSLSIFEQIIKTPVMAAPITGAKTNLGGAITEEEYIKSIINGCIDANTLAFVGDGADPEKFKLGLKIIKQFNGKGIPIFKPRTNETDLRKRIEAANKANVIAMGIDIDAAGFLTMELKNQSVEPKSVRQLQKIIEFSKTPFILKGIMTVEDALKAVDSGAEAIIVSNHGGRVMDHMPGVADVLENICNKVGKYIKIFADGGIRTGVDVLKILALGADAVLIGRPITIAAIGANAQGVNYYINMITDELKKSMILTGVKSLSNIDKSILFKGEVL